MTHMSFVNELNTPLMTVKKNLLRAGLFPGCFDNCRYCASEPNGCAWLKRGVQRLIDNRDVLFMKTPSIESLCEDVSKSLKIEDVIVEEVVPEVWDTLGQPSGKFDFMVKYT